MNRGSVFKRALSIFLPVLLIIALFPAAIFASEAGEKVEVRLKAGSKIVKINGQPTTVEAPFVKSGTTMVPLRIITNAFGAGLKLENGNVITLAYNDRKVVLTFGSKTVSVNGKNQTVAIAPVVVKGSTMVPLRVIVEAFGAKITNDAATKETVIVGVRALTSGDGSSIDADSGKTKVGDSYGNWTMNYPVGLVQVEQSDSGDYVRWSDAKESAQVIVVTEQIEDDQLTSSEIRDKMTGYFVDGELAIDKRTVSVSGLQYEKITSYSKKFTTYSEFRGIQQGSTLYVVMLFVSGNEKTVLNGYQSLLDSFKPSFNKSDKTIKDVTKVKNGVITHTDERYGLSLQLPVGWYAAKETSTPFYFSKEGSLFFYISSAVSGDTLQAWAARREKGLRDQYVSSYLRNITTTPLKLKDGEALVLSYQYSKNLKDWSSVNEVMLISGEYRYEFDFTIYEQSNEFKLQQVYRNAMTSLDIDTDFIAKEFGLIESEWDNDNRSKTIVKRSSKYGYSMNIFASWSGVETDFNADGVLYNIDGGYMNIYENDLTSSELASGVSTYVNSAEGTRAGLTVKEHTTVTINGKQAVRMVLHLSKTETGAPSTQYAYIFNSGNGSLVFEFGIDDAQATERNLKMINDAVQSIKFN